MRRGVLVRTLVATLLAGQLGTVWAEELREHSETPVIHIEKATFAGGCFWCMEGPFDHVDGVTETLSGYSGGTEVNPTYQEVAQGKTGHAESIQVRYDPSTVNYEQLLEVFWHQINPTQVNGQFADHGRQYRTAIFYHNDEQKRLADTSKAALEHAGKFTQPIVTDIVPASMFYPAEEYHQDYYKKHPVQYKLYRIGSGLDRYLKATWGDSGH